MNYKKIYIYFASAFIFMRPLCSQMLWMFFSLMIQFYLLWIFKVLFTGENVYFTLSFSFGSCRILLSMFLSSGWVNESNFETESLVLICGKEEWEPLHLLSWRHCLCPRENEMDGVSLALRAHLLQLWKRPIAHLLSSLIPLFSQLSLLLFPSPVCAPNVCGVRRPCMHV